MKNKITYTIARFLLGLGFIFFGAVKFFPAPEAILPQPAADFMAAMMATGYMIPFIGVAEVLVGLLLVLNLWVPLSMVILSPIMLNIALFNAFLAPSWSSFVMMVVLIVFQAYIMFYTWPHYKPLFARRIK